MKMGFATKKPIDLNRLSAGITNMINSLGVEGRIQCVEGTENIEFTFNTKDVFDYDEDGVERPYLIGKK